MNYGLHLNNAQKFWNWLHSYPTKVSLTYREVTDSEFTKTTFFELILSLLQIDWSKFFLTWNLSYRANTEYIIWIFDKMITL